MKTGKESTPFNPGSCATGIILLLSFILGSAGPARSQTGTITGQVVDVSTGLPLPGARVTVVGTRIQERVGDVGSYVLSGVPAGNRVVEAALAGYVSAQKSVTLPVGQSVVVDFALQPAGRQVPFEARSLTDIVIQANPIVALPRPSRHNTESYAHIEENDFQIVSVSPLSTFSIDVDRASYANIRRYIQSGERPPVDAVRIEEMINYFPYAWDNVGSEHPFAVMTEVWEAPWKREHRLVRIGLRARSVDTEHLPSANLVFLLDVSGSMRSPDKLPLLKKAFSLLVEQLRPRDRVAVVVYAGAAGLILPSTPGDRRGEILAAVQKLEAGGSTAGGAGLQLAYDVVRENYIDGGNNRVILATDGDFNVGASSDAEMVRLIEREREGGAFLTVLGFGAGNLKDSKMEQIANHGNGNFHYVDNLLEARKVLVEEMGGTLLTLAKDMKLQVEFNPERVAGYRLIGYENRLLDAEDFSDDTKDAGELGAGHTVTALYEVVPNGLAVPRSAGTEPLRYQPSAERQPTGEFDEELMYIRVRYKDPDGSQSKLLGHPVAEARNSPSVDFRFATSVAAFGMLLRDSPHIGAYTLEDVIHLADRSRGPDRRGYRGEFVRLVEAVRDLGMLKVKTGFAR